MKKYEETHWMQIFIDYAKVAEYGELIYTICKKLF
jgi:hypothetical protein